jgi:hypothetical protein
MVADDPSNPVNWLGEFARGDLATPAARAGERSAFLASALAEYISLREWTPQRLAEYLRCAPNQLGLLGLCRRPDPASADFSEQVSVIVGRFQLDYWSLRRLLEELSLPAEQRTNLWQQQDIEGPHPGRAVDLLDWLQHSAAPPDRRAIHHATDKTFSAEVRERLHKTGEVDMHRGEQPSPSGQVPPATPQSVARASQRPSWLGRLWARIRKIFAGK